MPDDDWALSNHTVEFRQEERMSGAGSSPASVWPAQSYRAGNAGGPDQSQRADLLSFCTETLDCQAEPDAHLEGCPVELRLQNELGF